MLLLQCSAVCNLSERSVPDLAATGPPGWKISIRRRKEEGWCRELLVMGQPHLCSHARAPGGAVCMLWVWSHQHTGDICPLVMLSPCPDGAKSLLFPCQLRHGVGIPTWWLTLKLGQPWVQGSGRQAGAVCSSCFRGCTHSPSLGNFKPHPLFSQMGQERCFCPADSRFPFSMQPPVDLLQQWPTLGKDLLSPLVGGGGYCQKIHPGKAMVLCPGPGWRSGPSLHSGKLFA